MMENQFNHSMSQNEINANILPPVEMEEDQVALIEREETINCVRFKPQKLNEQPIVATAHVVGSIKLHRAAPQTQSDDEKPSFELACEFKDHFFPVNDLHFTQRNPWLATCANDTIVNLFDIEKGMLCRSFIGGHSNFVTKCIINKYENILFSTGTDNSLFIWDIR